MSFIGIRISRNLANAHVAQLAERVLGKDEVISSILIMGSRRRCDAKRVAAAYQKTELVI